MAASLIGGPDFYNRRDPTRLQIMDFAENVLVHDGEFILKVFVLRLVNLLRVADSALGGHVHPT